MAPRRRPRRPPQVVLVRQQDPAPSAPARVQPLVLQLSDSQLSRRLLSRAPREPSCFARLLPSQWKPRPRKQKPTRYSSGYVRGGSSRLPKAICCLRVAASLNSAAWEQSGSTSPFAECDTAAAMSVAALRTCLVRPPEWESPVASSSGETDSV